MGTKITFSILVSIYEYELKFECEMTHKYKWKNFLTIKQCEITLSSQSLYAS